MNKISINDDFDLSKIISSGQCFRPCVWEDGFRFISGDKVLYIRQLSEGEYAISCSPGEWDSFWQGYFDLGRNYAALRNKAACLGDDYMAAASDAGAGIRILKQDRFETLISFIISQRRSIPAIRTAVERLCDTFGTAVCTEHGTVMAFPEPIALAGASDAELAACGLGYRTPYVRDAAEKVAFGVLPLEELCKLDDEALFSSLCSVKGVGTKVANCVMLFAYARCSRAPVDTWIQKLIDQIYAGENPFPKYGDVAGIMQQYAFYYIQQNKASSLWDFQTR